ILDGVEARLPIRDGGVHVVLLVPIDRHADEGEEGRIPRLHRPGEEDGVSGDPVLAHAPLNEIDAEVDVTADLDGAAEGDLPVALREVEVPAGELGAPDMHRVVDARSPGEVLDVVVAPVLTRGHGPGTLAGDLVQLGTLELASQDPLRVRRQGE